MNLKNILEKSLSCESTYNELKELNEIGTLEQIIPKIKGMKEVGECKYHVVNVYEHSLNALDEFENIIRKDDFFSKHLSKDIEAYLNVNVADNLKKFQLLKLGVFLHDIGKPDSKTIDDTGRAHFKGHEMVGEDIIFNLGVKLELHSEIIDLLAKYVRYHMTLLVLYKRNNMSQQKLYEIFDILGDDTIGTIILGYCDIVATRKLLNPSEDTGVIKTYMEYILTNYIYRYKR